MRRLLLALCAALACALPAHAHVGSKDVFEQVDAGPYRLFVTIRPPTVIPGVATIEVRTSGATASSVQVTPLPLTGEASRHPPTADPLKRSSADPAFFTGSLWLMASGSWQVRFEVLGSAGAATASVPVPAVQLAILRMQRPLGITLGLLGLLLAIGMAGIVAAAVRESRLQPGSAPPAPRRRRARAAGLATFAVVLLLAYLGNVWWKVDAASSAADIYRPLSLHPVLQGNTLDLKIGSYNAGPLRQWKTRHNDDLLPDHGHLMHLYAIREPGMDAVFHLHPALVEPGDLRTTLPSMPAGDYRLYADIVHATGFPETLTTTLTIPPDLPAAPLDAEDASAAPPSLSAGDLGPLCKLPDGYTMIWDKPAALTADTAYAFRFHLLNAAGKPATDVHPYLGMAGHAAFVKADGTTFAHTHPEGSAAMPAMMLANGGDTGMSAMSGSGPEAIPPTVEFPYGFPSSGRYRIFIQMKHGHTVETGVFDAEAR